MDLTKNDRCYTYYLKENKANLRSAAFSDKIDLDFYRAIVGKTIKPAPWTAKKKEFFRNLNTIDDKVDIYYYIKNSINKAENYVEIDKN